MRKLVDDIASLDRKILEDNCLLLEESTDNPTTSLKRLPRTLKEQLEANPALKNPLLDSVKELVEDLLRCKTAGKRSWDEDILLLSKWYHLMGIQYSIDKHATGFNWNKIDEVSHEMQMAPGGTKHRSNWYKQRQIENEEKGRPDDIIDDSEYDRLFPEEDLYTGSQTDLGTHTEASNVDSSTTVTVAPTSDVKGSTSAAYLDRISQLEEQAANHLDQELQARMTAALLSDVAIQEATRAEDNERIAQGNVAGNVQKLVDDVASLTGKIPTQQCPTVCRSHRKSKNCRAAWKNG